MYAYILLFITEQQVSVQVMRADEEKRLAEKKKQEEERRQREVEEKKQRDIEEKRRRLEEAEKKRQAMMSALKVSQCVYNIHLVVSDLFISVS